MAILLGVDTGGTYTDAVLVQDDARVLASAKALTTRHDLAEGVRAAIVAVLDRSGVRPDQVALASLSTTLATNALVEGHGGRVALVYVGFRAADLEKHGLTEALKGDPALVLDGGHTHAGTPLMPLDRDALQRFVETHRGQVTGYAVAAQFATRNPAHELEAARIIAEAGGVPVTCSHQLSARLNGPKRAVTAVLNARLIGMIDGLIRRTRAALDGFGIDAPLMVVRGDGALMSADQARARPIETILSGPAASIVGARWLTDASDALVSDIGGTTTDVAVLRGGRPAIDPAGAEVGGFRTMVEAVAMRTTGLGGDSQVQVNAGGLGGGVRLGPRRVLPVALAAHEAPDVVLPALEAQLRNPVPSEHDAAFLRAVPGLAAEGLSPREADLLTRIDTAMHPVGAVLRNRMDNNALSRLVDRGLVQVSGPTPSDAAHVLGLSAEWNADAARLAMALLARKRVGTGEVLARNAVEMARMIADQLTHQTVRCLLETAFAEDTPKLDLAPAELARHPLTMRGLDRHRSLLAMDLRLNLPVIGLGASAPTWYPPVGERLGCDMILPEHAGVANAIGAVVGRVTMRRSGTVTSPSEGRFRAHLDSGPEDFADEQSAIARLRAALTDAAERDARAAGAEDIETTCHADIRRAQAEARQVFVEATLTVEAGGRPRIAIG